MVALFPERSRSLTDGCPAVRWILPPLRGDRNWPIGPQVRQRLFLLRLDANTCGVHAHSTLLDFAAPFRNDVIRGASRERRTTTPSAYHTFNFLRDSQAFLSSSIEQQRLKLVQIDLQKSLSVPCPVLQHSDPVPRRHGATNGAT